MKMASGDAISAVSSSQSPQSRKSVRAGVDADVAHVIRRVPGARAEACISLIDAAFGRKENVAARATIARRTREEWCTMSVLPVTIIGQIEFCEVHAPVWAANVAGLGITAAQSAALTAATEEARIAYDDAQKARDASKAATTEMKSEASQMKNVAASLLRSIKTYAEQQADPNAVYALAQIPPPSGPTPLPLPGKPNNIVVTLLATGAVQLTWDSENAAASSGVFFNVFRKLPGQTNFMPIGGTSGSTNVSRRMTFVDGTVPTSAAASGVQYVMQGQRGTQQGLLSDAITVQFGTDTPGGLSVQGAEGIKLAA
jgi:hypothetical protein